MASSTSSKPTRVSVKTTLPARPLPPNSSRLAATSDRLLIRALVPEDLQSLHVLRTQPEVMATTPQLRVDKSLEETKPWLDRFLPPNDEATFHFAICLKETGEMIGIGGCHGLASIFGWPVIGYMFRKEFWGQGVATEFLHTWLGMWCKLPREEVEIDVDPRTVPDGDGLVPEQVTALTILDNVGSQRVLEKCGFENFATWLEPDLRDPEVDVLILGFRHSPSKEPEI